MIFRIALLKGGRARYFPHIAVFGCFRKGFACAHGHASAIDLLLGLSGIVLSRVVWRECTVILNVFRFPH